LQTWLQHVLRDRAANNDEPSCEAELKNGMRVRLQLIVGREGCAAVALSPLPDVDAASRRDDEEARLLGLVEWLEEGVVLFDAENGIRAMNSRFAQIAGLSVEETNRIKRLDGLIACMAGRAAEPASFAESWRGLASSTQVAVREEIQLLRPVPRVLERAARSIVDSSGRRLGRVEIYRDVTAQRLFHSKLLQTEKLAALGQMITGVAHELSSPLTSILGYAQRLLLRNDPGGNREEAAQILQEAERASAILRQLLVTARESRPGRSKVALNEVISRTMELLKFSLTAERVHVELALDPNIPLVHGDAGQLQRCAYPSRQVGGLIEHEPGDLAADHTTAEQGDAQRLHRVASGCHPTSRASRSSIVSRRTRTVVLPSSTATTGGRGVWL